MKRTEMATGDAEDEACRAGTTPAVSQSLHQTPPSISPLAQAEDNTPSHISRWKLEYGHCPTCCAWPCFTRHNECGLHAPQNPVCRANSAPKTLLPRGTLSFGGHAVLFKRVPHRCVTMVLMTLHRGVARR